MATKLIVVEESGSTKTTRMIRLEIDTGFDVDSVDECYSLDVSMMGLPLLVEWLSEKENLSSSLPWRIVDHKITVSDEERVRLFLVYDGKKRRLSRVVLCDGRRVVEDTMIEKRTDGESLSHKTNGRMIDSLRSIIGYTDYFSSSSSSLTDVMVLRHLMSLFGLLSGLWLGYMVVRRHTHPSSRASRRGFSSSTPRDK